MRCFWGEDDPLFPKTETGLGPQDGFVPIGLSREGWKSAEPIRDIFKPAFETADLP